MASRRHNGCTWDVSKASIHARQAKGSRSGIELNSMEEQVMAAQHLTAGVAAGWTLAQDLRGRELPTAVQAPPGWGHLFKIQTGTLGNSSRQHDLGCRAQGKGIHPGQMAHPQVNRHHPLGPLTGGHLQHPLGEGHHQA